MKNGDFLTKTEYGLLILTALLLILMTALFARTSTAGDTGVYTITTREHAEEVVPETALPVNINTATAEELDVLPGIGPALAGRIIAYREAHGPFTEAEQLLEVSGIGEAVLDGLRDQIVLEEAIG